MRHIGRDVAMLDSNNTNNWHFEIMPKGKPAKAKLHFAPDSLLDIENLFIFTGTDAAGNKLSETYRLNVAINNNILSHYAFPNPSDINESVSIEYELARATENATAQIDIFDATGQKVQTLTDNFALSKKNSIV